MLKEPDPLLILGPTFSRYYNAIVGPMMTFLVRSFKILDLQHWGSTICLKNKLDGHRPEDCLIRSKLKRTFFGSMLKLINFLRYYIYRAYTIIVDLFIGHRLHCRPFYFLFWSFLNIWTALSRVSIIILKDSFRVLFRA